MKSNVLAMSLGKILKAKAAEYNTRAVDAVSTNREAYVRSAAMEATFRLIDRIVEEMAEMPPDKMLKMAERMALSAHFSRLGGTYRLSLDSKKGGPYIFRGKEYSELPFDKIKAALEEEGDYAV